MRRVRLRVLLLTAGLAFSTAAGFVACGDTGSSAPAPTDAAADSPPNVDVGVDSRAPDGTVTPVVDSATPMLPPGDWEQVPSIPCKLLQSKTPKISAPAFPWRTCPSGRSGCELFTFDWSPSEVDTFSLSRHALPYEDGLGVHLSYTRIFGYGTLEAASVAVVQPLHGAGEVVLAGPRTAPSCFPGKIHGSPFGVAAAIVDSVDGSLASARTHIVFGSNAAPLDLSSALITTAIPNAGVSQGLTHGDGFVAAELTGGGSIFPVALRFSDLRAIPATTPPRPGGEFAAAPGGYYALIDDNLHFVPIGGAAQTVARPSAGCSITKFTVDRANGNTLVWLESSSDFSDNRIYASVFATSEATLQRRLVTKVPTATFGVANGGVIAVPLPSSQARIIRLSDGRGWLLEGETNVPLSANVWVNADSAWFGTSRVPAGQPGYPRFNGMIRLPRPTGEPTIPSEM